MKPLNKTILGLFFLGFSLSMSAQVQRQLDPTNMREGEDVEYCIQHKKMMELLKDPAAMKIYQAQQLEAKRIVDSLQNNRGLEKQATLYKIPIVFHVLHNGGPENISRDQILDALDILNRDFRLLNSDANNVVSTFQGLPADVEIEFVLATKAPDGSCFSGITRTQNALTDDGSSGIAQVNAIVNGNDVYNGTWAEKKYLNIFICNEIGGAAGYTYNPFGSGNSTSGIWVLQNYVGSIGTSSVYTSRTLTHEVGHWLNLDHTWGGNNNPGNASSCNDDDNVDDTPRCIGVTACVLSTNSCSNDATDGYWSSDVVDNVENYMDYSYCSKMFTQGQVDRMRASLLSSQGGRNNLWTTSNLNAAGANGNAPLCAADFFADKFVVCAGDSVHFTDDSYHNVTGWTWTLTGATPSSSNLEDPAVVYNTPGTYSVSLSATDGSSSVSKTQSAYITVLPSTGRSVPVVEGFETLTLPDAEWIVENPDGSNAWAITSTAGATGSKSLKLNNTSNQAGDVDEFVSSTIDLSGVNDLELSFKYAFAQKSSSNTDYLRVYTSNDCGESWSVRKNISSSVIATAANTSSAFTPSSSDWETVTVTNITSSFWTENFRFKLSFVSGGGNNVYIDDINIFDPSNSSSGIESAENLNYFKVYPNPADDLTNVAISLNTTGRSTISVTDMIGKEVLAVVSSDLSAGEHLFPINTSNFSRGIYFINVNVDGKLLSKKLIIE